MEKLIISVYYWLYWQGSIITLISKQDTLREKVSALWWLCSLVLPAPPTLALTLEWEGLATRDEYQALHADGTSVSTFRKAGPRPWRSKCKPYHTYFLHNIYTVSLLYTTVISSFTSFLNLPCWSVESNTRFLLRTTPIKMEWKFLFTPSYAHQSLKLSFIIYCFSSTFFNFIYFFVFSSNFFSY